VRVKLILKINLLFFYTSTFRRAFVQCPLLLPHFPTCVCAVPTAVASLSDLRLCSAHCCCLTFRLTFVQCPLLLPHFPTCVCAVPTTVAALSDVPLCSAHCCCLTFRRTFVQCPLLLPHFPTYVCAVPTAVASLSDVRLCCAHCCCRTFRRAFVQCPLLLPSAFPSCRSLKDFSIPSKFISNPDTFFYTKTYAEYQIWPSKLLRNPSAI